MKKFLTLMIIAATTFAVTTNAEARPRYHGHTYVSGRTSCGCPVYSQRYVARYDRCGTPVFSVRRLPQAHRCRTAVRPRVHYRYSTPRTVYRSQRSHYQPYYGKSRGHGRGYSSRGYCR